MWQLTLKPKPRSVRRAINIEIERLAVRVIKLDFAISRIC